MSDVRYFVSALACSRFLCSQDVVSPSNSSWEPIMGSNLLPKPFQGGEMRCFNRYLVIWVKKTCTVAACMSVLTFVGIVVLPNVADSPSAFTRRRHMCLFGDVRLCRQTFS